MKLTNVGLVDHVKILLSMLTVYVYGTYGKLFTNDIAVAKAKQYPNQNTDTRLKVYKTLINKKFYAMDCVGLIKSYLWGGIDNIKYNSATDKSANGMYIAAKKKGNIDYNQYKYGLPEVVGLAVQMNGHIGVYIGNGKVIESTPNTKYAKQSHGLGGVCETSIKDRQWEHWLYIPYIEYIETTSENESKYTVEKGDTLSSIGAKIGVAWKEIAKLNGIESPYLIRIGQVLKIIDTPVQNNEKEDVPIYLRVTGCTTLRCRKIANGDIIGYFANGTKVEVLDQSNKSWYKVKGKSTAGKTVTGYCGSKYLK